ncbi:drug/metabolite transporter superfamily protein [Thecamonas trahens ATCC 50062]|uniref:Drug/metabolite transporter superfamily protein n=1 Tax=Thecamonas trahens ATCC 50062 TaxID=461836 RepID=A0A0L0DXD4_THETB|nr:drug/metabolite transporter superfamily protein [Thecamonas trahens ATCC 50062]KNC56193.1 drug/metabolite transporter superfamily protein [Thecamonas trahens ATCC 50062]|eukprot:XP_013752683.1 drug/metabolite transporter superfamily protein [Thecamonas trahens ATCC 50062]
MWTPESHEAALLVAMGALIAWGSWSNTVKLAQVSWTRFYPAYVVGAVLAAVVLGATLGGPIGGGSMSPSSTNTTTAATTTSPSPGTGAGASIPSNLSQRLLMLSSLSSSSSSSSSSSLLSTDDGSGGSASGGPSTWHSLGNAGGKQVAMALGAGVVFNVANMLLTWAITVCGMATAFPLGIGTALVVGTSFNYSLEPKGKPGMIAGGCGLALAAVAAMGVAHGLHQRIRGGSDERHTDDEAGRPLLVNGRGAGSPPRQTEMGLGRQVALCVAAGVLMGLWSPLSVASMSGAHGLTTYGTMVLYVMGMAGSSLVLVPICVRLVGSNSDGGNDEAEASAWRVHAWGMLGGMVWCCGTWASLVSGKKLGYGTANVGHCGVARV